MKPGDGASRAAAYGGPGWRPRAGALRDELGRLWAACGVDSEWAPLEHVLLHAPGPELAAIEDADAALMLDRPDPDRARREHAGLAAAYRAAGVEVSFVEPTGMPPPNQMFVADLFVMTPEGAIVGRPASAVRAGEERWVASRLAELGIPILRTVSGAGTFEGADAMWLDRGTALVARGPRTNAAGAAQVAATLREQGVDVVVAELDPRAMHLMGALRIVDARLAFHRAGQVAAAALDALRDRGYDAVPFPEHPDVRDGMAHNVVTLGPRQVLVPAGRPALRAFYEDHGIACVEVEIGELTKAAGGIACLTGVLRRGRA